MARSNADLAALKDELTNDPKNLGLTLLEADDAENADKLTAVSPSILVKRRSLGTNTLFDATRALERQSLTEQQARDLSWILQLGQIDPFADTNTMETLIGDQAGMFGAESESRAAIEAAIMQPGSRVEQMFQEGLLSVGGDLSPSDVAAARQYIPA